MKINKKIMFAVFLLVVVLSSSLVLAYSRSSHAYTQFDSFDSYGEGYWQRDGSMCEDGQDFVIQIAPFGCEPSVVRSDLLEEQNVAVFCQLAATQINPLIDVEAIEHIDFDSQGSSSDHIYKIGFHPAKAALGGSDLDFASGYGARLNSPVLNNIGYAVVVLKKTKNESSMPDYVEGDLNAKIRYDIVNAYGIGPGTFYLPEMEEGDWEKSYSQYSFWDSRGYLRAEGVDEDGARIIVYADDSYGGSTSGSVKRQITSVRLREGETSPMVYLPGFDCLGGMEVRLDSLESPDTRVKLDVNGEIVEVARGEKFLENKCTLYKFENEGLNQYVHIRCDSDHGESRKLELEIKPEVKIEYCDANGENCQIKSFQVGDAIYQDSNLNREVYVGYIGEDEKGRKFIIPVLSESYSKIDTELIKHYSKAIEDSEQKQTAYNLVRQLGAEIITLFRFIQGGSDFSDPLYLGEESKEIKFTSTNVEAFLKDSFINTFALMVGIINPEDLDKSLKGYEKKKIRFDSFASPVDFEISNENYDKAMNDYEIVINDFPNEEKAETVFAELALKQKIVLANKFGQKQSVFELCEEFTRDYPKTSLSLPSECKSDYKMSNSEFNSKTALVNGRAYSITLIGITEPGYEDYGAEIRVRGTQGLDRPYYLERGRRVMLSADEWFELERVDEYSVRIKANVKRGSGYRDLAYEPEDYTIDLDKDIDIGANHEYELTLVETKLRKLARVSLIPNVNNAETEANFSFKIGIEKREEGLMPDNIEEKIEDLDDKIESWEDKSETLGDFVEGFKKSCLGVGAALTAKNFLANMGGKSIARQNVMRGDGGWYYKCTDAVGGKGELGNEGYKTTEECLYQNGDKIDEDVDDMYNLIQSQNEKIKTLQEDITSVNYLGEKHVDTNKFIENYAPQVQTLLNNYKGNKEIINPYNAQDKINMDEFSNLISSQGFENGNYNVDQLKEIELYTQMLEKDPNNELAKERLYSVMSDVKANSYNFEDKSNLAADLNIQSKNIGILEVGYNAKSLPYHGLTYDDIDDTTPLSGVENPTTPIEVLATTDGKKYFIVLDDSTGGDTYPIKSVYTTEGDKLDQTPADLDKVYFKRYDRTTYDNEFKSTSGDTYPMVKYYETEPYKGYPAIVPFDLRKGWYAATRQTLPIFGNIKAYDDSGRVTSVYVCNVGQNGREEFKSGIGDDICEMVNLGTGQAYNQFPGLDEGEASKVIRCAVDAIEDASRQYDKGGSNVKISTSCASESIRIGNPVVDIPDMQCQDFMSPKDCQILFNVCDPVICPSSRCDFGGAYPVKDVIQSGIIGSLALCLPNFREGIYVPICVSGVKAGIDGLISVQKSYRDCLQTSLDTGEMVGICDEIYSIHLCEFLWRQGIPLAKVALPKLLELVTGQNVHGGGEYLGVQSAWENAGQSVDYFTKYYAANSYKAFQARTAEDVGSDVCENYASAVYPDGGNIIDALTEPDSPPQFHGRFDEIEFTDVTSPPISQYKVYYHVYAGDDSRAYYSVYLKPSPGGTFYQDTSSRRNVASGFIGKGEYASETKDFTAPSGYRELCINVNGQEECGFKQVSTSFAVNYVTDQALENQATQKDIKSESECISGRVSAYSLLNPSLMGAAEELVDPAIYNRGIIRVCSTDNPGKGSDGNWNGENSRWQQVGYCDDKKVKCWLDSESIEDAVNFDTSADQVLSDLNNNTLKMMQVENGYLNDVLFNQMLKDIQDAEGNPDKQLEIISKDFEKVFWNPQKAEIYFLRGDAYHDLAIKERDITEDADQKKKAAEAGDDPVGPEDEEPLCSIDHPDEKYSELSDARSRVLAAIEDYNEKPAKRTSTACFAAAYKIYNKADVTHSCVYSDYEGTTYYVGGGTQVVKAQTGHPWVVASNPDKICSLNRDSPGITWDYDEKIKYIQPGDFLHYVNSKSYGHNAIFLKWINIDTYQAEIFDWSGGDTSNRIYRKFIQTLSPELHPIYMYWEPVLGSLDAGSEQPISKIIGVESSSTDVTPSDDEVLDDSVKDYKFYTWVEATDLQNGMDLRLNEEFQFNFGYMVGGEDFGVIDSYKLEVFDSKNVEIDTEVEDVWLSGDDDQDFMWTPDKEGIYTIKISYSKEDDFEEKNIVKIIEKKISVSKDGNTPYEISKMDSISEESGDGGSVVTDGLLDIENFYDDFEYFIKLDNQYLFPSDGEVSLLPNKDYKFTFGYILSDEYSESQSWWKPTPIEWYGIHIKNESGNLVFDRFESDTFKGGSTEKSYTYSFGKSGKYSLILYFSKEDNLNPGNIVKKMEFDIDIAEVWTLSSANEILGEYIAKYGGSSDYDVNGIVEGFVIQIHNAGILTDDEMDEIDGTFGGFGKESLNYIKLILSRKEG